MTLQKILSNGIQENLFEIEKYLSKKNFTNITGDACVGDIVWFGRDLFSGSYRKPIFDGTEGVRAIIVKDSYGSDKQQHTFTLVLMKSATSKTHIKGSDFRIKGRNLYKHFTYCENHERDDRKEVLEDKHQRGTFARKVREDRRETQLTGY